MKKILAFISIILFILNCLSIVELATDDYENVVIDLDPSYSNMADVSPNLVNEIRNESSLDQNNIVIDLIPDENEENSGNNTTEEKLIEDYVHIQKETGVELPFTIERDNPNRIYGTGVTFAKSGEKNLKEIKGKLSISGVEGVYVDNVNLFSATETTEPDLYYVPETMEFSITPNSESEVLDDTISNYRMSYYLYATADSEYTTTEHCGEVKCEITEITTEDGTVVTNTQGVDTALERTVYFMNDWSLLTMPEDNSAFESGYLYKGVDIEKKFLFNCLPRIAGAQGHIELTGTEGVTIQDIQVVGRVRYNNDTQNYEFEDVKDANITEFNRANNAFMLELNDEKIGNGIEGYKAVISVKMRVAEDAVIESEDAKLKLVFDIFSDRSGIKPLNVIAGENEEMQLKAYPLDYDITGSDSLVSDYEGNYDPEYDEYGWKVFYGKKLQGKNTCTCGELLNKFVYKDTDLVVTIGRKNNMVEYTDNLVDMEFDPGDVLRFTSRSTGKVVAQYILQLVGDSDGDGEILINDVLIKRKIALGKEQKSIFKCCDDVNNDNSVDVADVVATRLRIINNYWMK